MPGKRNLSPTLSETTPSVEQFAVYYERRKAYYACKYAAEVQSRIDDMAGVELGEPNVRVEARCGSEE